jgi:predicted HicB family RNase H-like nuclease
MPKTLSVRIDEGFFKQVKYAAVEYDVSLETLVTEALRDWLRKKGAPGGTPSSPSGRR